ncbi:MAG TPA: MltA domain-containing protein [Aquabacterium sp.]|uniref:murein transglycosylase A n=1 Tax=Aquabacterium sp. TaxID=1872578 RepID=UPI002E329D02|nr:MltA domain-containing protein [Aquabacterium sp.]HEX5357617.1 MltA domain-containing protein [Aquabacterium sp.]
MMQALKPPSLPPRALAALSLAVTLALAACASGPKVEQAAQAPAGASAEGDGEADGANAAGARGQEGKDIATKHALFKVSAFESLPGWQQDNLGEAWTAFKESCKALERKPNWKPLCAKVKSIKDPKSGRQFLEREFALLTVQNTDRTREGEITGYYEPLLQGRAQRDAQFSVPVYGVPNDLYFLDWKTIPANQRKGVTHVRANGRLLSPAQAGQPGAVAVDMRRFTLDTLDRRLRVRLQGNEGLPYYTRADINRSAALDAPVLAWVDDPIALYAMQVQGTGRIRLPDGSILRLAYADQNGHPFKPMQLASSGNERVQTRGAKGEGADLSDEIEHFDLVDAADTDAATDTSTASQPADEPLTRGARKAGASGAPADPAVADAVDSLLPPAGARPNTKTSAGKAPITLTVPAVTPAKPQPAGGSQQLVDDLLTQAQKNARKVTQSPTPKAATQAATAREGSASNKLSTALLKQRSQALDSDPSYVFFRAAPDQSAQAGPVGALGVPLTAGRSLAVDPRVLPLGYPVFLDASAGDRRQTQMQRLMFAQDTGGAIRGAVRADYFWGFGADAGKQARRTKHRGRMWVLVPHAEVDSLLSSKLVTRGGKGGDEQRECLIDDEAFCDSDAAEDANSSR